MSSTIGVRTWIPSPAFGAGGIIRPGTVSGPLGGVVPHPTNSSRPARFLIFMRAPRLVQTLRRHAAALVAGVAHALSAGTADRLWIGALAGMRAEMRRRIAEARAQARARVVAVGQLRAELAHAHLVAGVARHAARRVERIHPGVGHHLVRAAAAPARRQECKTECDNDETSDRHA